MSGKRRHGVTFICPGTAQGELLNEKSRIHINEATRTHPKEDGKEIRRRAAVVYLTSEIWRGDQDGEESNARRGTKAERRQMEKRSKERETWLGEQTKQKLHTQTKTSWEKECDWISGTRAQTMRDGLCGEGMETTEKSRWRWSRRTRRDIEPIGRQERGGQNVEMQQQKGPTPWTGWNEKRSSGQTAQLSSNQKQRQLDRV
ncbi:hypothetical protein C8R45DRAFT_1127426 [Mycena sanguinolenta]|nr:hypothetical protein C8R45DRAFT_1127426 [Mycena sanguinolenta]